MATSSACGYLALHREEEKNLLNKSFIKAYRVQNEWREAGELDGKNITHGHDMTYDSFFAVVTTISTQLSACKHDNNVVIAVEGVIN